MDDYDEENDAPPTLKIFGRDVLKIPCFRESFINGITGGIGIGLASFLRTSNPRVACNYAMGSYTIITFVSYFYYRYKFTQGSILNSQIQEGMRQQVMYQGTDLDRQIRAQFDETNNKN